MGRLELSFSFRKKAPGPEGTRPSLRPNLSMFDLGNLISLDSVSLYHCPWQSCHETQTRSWASSCSSIQNLLQEAEPDLGGNPELPGSTSCSCSLSASLHVISKSSAHHHHCFLSHPHCFLSACTSFLSQQWQPHLRVFLDVCLIYSWVRPAVVLSDQLSRPKIWVLNPIVPGAKFLSRLNYFYAPLSDCHQLS